MSSAEVWVLAKKTKDRSVWTEPRFAAGADGFDFNHALGVTLTGGHAFAFAAIASAEKDHAFLE